MPANHRHLRQIAAACVAAVGYLAAAPVLSQVSTFDTKRCEGTDLRYLSETHAAFCTGYRLGKTACEPRPLERKEVMDACLAGATLHSQSRIRDYVDGPPGRAALRPTASPVKPAPEVCARTLVEQIGLAGVDEVRQAIAPRFQEIVVGTGPDSWNLRLEARRSACDDSRLSVVLYDFDAKGVLREVTYVWSRPVAGASANAVFKERAAALSRLYRLPPPQSQTRLEGTSKSASVVLEDKPDRNVVLEVYASPK